MKLIASRDNPFFKQLKRLAQSGRERIKAGLTVLDGAHLIRDYEAALGPVDTLVVEQDAAAHPEIAALLAGRPHVLLPAALFREAAVVEHPAGIMALVRLPEAAPLLSTLDTVVLDGVQDPGNVGTLLRTAAAAGFRQALLSADCAGAWSPRVLRAGQGAHFALAVHQSAELADFLSGFQGQVAVTTLAQSTSLYACNLRGPLAWVFGSEGHGVGSEIVALAQLKVRIPMPGQVESLNVAAAAAVCLFETVRQRSVE